MSKNLDLAVVSYDYARQMSIPCLRKQTMHESFAEKHGYDVGIFGIVDESSGNHGLSTILAMAREQSFAQMRFSQ